jgi:hypothetical protein
LAPVVSNPFMVNREDFDELPVEPILKELTQAPCNQSTTCKADIPLFWDFISGLPMAKEPEENRSQIEIPYAFIGVILFITGILINLLYLCVPYSSPNFRRRNVRNDPLSEPIERAIIPVRVKRSHFWVVLVFGSIIPCFYFSLCNNNFTYLQTFAMEIGYKKRTATLMYLIYSAVVAFACLCFMLLSTFMSPQAIIYMELIILLAADCVLLYLCHTKPQMIWLGICLLGFGISSIYPSLYSFIKQRIEVNNNVGSLVVFSGSLISVIFPILEGNYLQKYPNIFPLINLCATICILVLFTLMHSADCYYGFPLKSSRNIPEPDVFVTEISTTSFADQPTPTQP